MSKNNPPQFTLATGTDLAFTLVVFVVFFTAFSAASITSLFLILLIICLGIAYICNGIYGFAYARKSNRLAIQLAYFALQLVLGGFIIYFGRGAGFSAMILLPVVAHAAMLLDQDWALITNVGIFLTYVLSTWAYSHDLGHVWAGVPILFVVQVFILIFTQMAMTELRARQNMEKTARELAEANRQLSDYAEQVHDLSVAQERNRFAREIHDGLGHYLTTINMQLNAAQAIVKIDPKKTVQMLQKAQEMTSEALDDVRISVFALRKDALPIESLIERIQKLITDTSVTDAKVGFQVKGTPRDLSPQADLTIYRTAQEGINNAQKHSKATVINCCLDYQEVDLVEFVVEDNGVGSENADEGFGLIGIQERVRLMKGDVLIESKPGEGFRIRIRIPG